MPWYVIYTKSRNERLVADRLREKGVEVYCPLTKIRRKWSDRTKIVEEPLFRSYCFVNLEETERAQVFGVPGFVRYLFWQKQPAIVRDAEIDAIKLMLNEVDHEQLVVRSFQPGDRATIGSGSFQGVEGTIIWKQGRLVGIQLPTLQAIITVDQSKSILLA